MKVKIAPKNNRQLCSKCHRLIKEKQQYIIIDGKSTHRSCYGK